ncbi:MAG: PilZ domain-containing protein [Polyangiaceae bacterium]|nr:PilZ domain-containing protein [Polyangiaceae bacterium]
MRDHRKHPRTPLQAAVAFQVADGPRIEATCRDISLGGMFIETLTPAPFGAPVIVYLSLPGLRQEVAVRSTVRWTMPDGMGVQFGVMGARETHALTQLLGSA